MTERISFLIMSLLCNFQSFIFFLNLRCDLSSLFPSPVFFLVVLYEMSLLEFSSFCSHLLKRNFSFLTLIPMLSKSSLFVIGNTTASMSSWICLSSPPISDIVKKMESWQWCRNKRWCLWIDVPRWKDWEGMETMKGRWLVAVIKSNVCDSSVKGNRHNQTKTIVEEVQYNKLSQSGFDIHFLYTRGSLFSSW